MESICNKTLGKKFCALRQNFLFLFVVFVSVAGVLDVRSAHAQNFGIDGDGVLFHAVPAGYENGFQFLCVNGENCVPGERVGNFFRRDISGALAVGASTQIQFKVGLTSGQCVTGLISITREAGGSSVESPCAEGNTTDPDPQPNPDPDPDPQPNPDPDPQPNPGPGNTPGASSGEGAGLISVEGGVITTVFAERFRDRHESDANHDIYINEYAEGSAYGVILTDRADGLLVQVSSPDTPLSMVNFTHDHILNEGFADPPQYRGGGFMAKGSLNGPADDSAGNLANNLFFLITQTNGKPWAEVRANREIVTIEFTPRRQLNGNFPQYYSDIIRYRAGQGGITFERSDARYFSAGPTTNFAHGSDSFQYSQAFLGIDQPLLNRFTLGRELFRADFTGTPLPGNGGTASGADPSLETACINCHFQLGAGAPPGRAGGEQQGFINSGRDLRTSPRLIGLGLLEAVDQSTLESLARRGGGKVGNGRFGWKATQPTIASQVRTAFEDDMGISNPSGTHVNRMVSYIRGLGVPIRRHPEAEAAQQPNTRLRIPDAQTILDSDVLDGEAAFRESGCVGCHIPELTTGNSHPVRQFRNITIRPFTDLLLWDMGEELCAASGEGNADRCEWRTAPLWGGRLQEEVTGHATFLHDGRATSRDEAIRLHGGDAADSTSRYEALSANRRNNLILYLRTL